jgi:predicted tellurium resistance membrane protein TerC
MAELFAASSLLALVAVTALEIVLGVDNLVFIAILTGRLPRERRTFARRLGLGAAALGRIMLLLAASWVITLEQSDLIDIPRLDIKLTIRDVILIAGGAFLLAKATWEIHETLEGAGHNDQAPQQNEASVPSVVGQILLLDLVFSIDSVLTAVAVVEPHKFQSAPVPFTTVPWSAMLLMSVAVLAAVAVMLWFIGPVSNFIERHPTIKMLALAFLLLIGVVLVADGLGQHIPRGYIYFAMGFSVFVEMLNLKLRSRREAKATAEA